MMAETSVEMLSEELQDLEEERTRLRHLVATLAEENRRLAERCCSVAQEKCDMVSLYVASRRLTEAIERPELLEAVREIVTDILGCEEMALFEKTEQGELEMAFSAGIDPAPFRRLSSGAIATVARTGRQLHVEDHDWTEGAEERLTACIPLVARGEVIGALALFRLLGHQRGIDQLGRSVLDLLVHQVGNALALTRS